MDSRSFILALTALSTTVALLTGATSAQAQFGGVPHWENQAPAAKRAKPRIPVSPKIKAKKKKVPSVAKAKAQTAPVEIDAQGYKWKPWAFPDAFLDGYREAVSKHREALRVQSKYNLASLSPRKSNQCRQFYRNFYQRHNLLIRIVYGYYDMYFPDNYQMTGDRAEIGFIQQQLGRDCVDEHEFACGFKIAESGDRFTKTIKGPDNRERQVILELVHSSATDNDRANRAQDSLDEMSEEQRARTEHATKKFFDGFTEADVLIYLGHARDGGGPSFEPAKLIEDPYKTDAPVDYSFYAKKRPGLTRMVEALRATQTPPKVLALFACSAQGHFLGARNLLAREMRKIVAEKKITVMASTARTDSFADLPNAIGVIDSLLAMRCDQGFAKSFGVKSNQSRMHLSGPRP